MSLPPRSAGILASLPVHRKPFFSATTDLPCDESRTSTRRDLASPRGKRGAVQRGTTARVFFHFFEGFASPLAMDLIERSSRKGGDGHGSGWGTEPGEITSDPPAKPEASQTGGFHSPCGHSLRGSPHSTAAWPDARCAARLAGPPQRRLVPEFDERKAEAHGLTGCRGKNSAGMWVISRRLRGSALRVAAPALFLRL